MSDAARTMLAAPEPRPDQATDRRRQIAEAATELLAVQSYAAVTVQDIATRTGMSVGNIYRYVKGKEEILLLIFDHILTRYETELPPLAEGPDPAPDKLWRAVRTYVHIIDSEPVRTLITYRESGSLAPAALDEVKSRERASNRPIEAIIEEGVAGGEFHVASPALTAYTIATLAHMWALKGWWLRSRMTAYDYAVQQYRTVLAGLTSDPVQGRPLP